MLLVAAAISALLVGPLIYHAFRGSPRLRLLLDILVIGSIGGVVLLEVLPESYRIAGLVVVAFAAVGFLGPTAVEQLLHRTHLHRVEKLTHVLTLVAGMTGVLLHAVADGAVLAGGEGAGGSPVLALAVILHRVPVGLTVWWVLRPVVGVAIPSAVVATVAIGTVIGYVAGPEFSASASPRSLALFQAFVSGTLLHVVLFPRHLVAHADSERDHGETAG
jgi:hypothetical protein